MKPSKSEFRELASNDRGEIVAIRGYNKFYTHLLANGRVEEARKIIEIRREEEVHRRELAEIKRKWMRMK
jgi:rubrerythrin